MIFLSRFQACHETEIPFRFHQDLRHAAPFRCFTVHRRQVDFISKWTGEHTGGSGEHLEFVFKKPTVKVPDKYAAFRTVELKNHLGYWKAIISEMGVIQFNPASTKHEPAIGMGGKITPFGF